MKIYPLVLGAFETNCYIVQDENRTDCVIIDTGLQSEPLIDFLSEKDLRPTAVILTHGHADHIEGVGLLRENWPDIKVYIHKKDSEMLTKPASNLSMLTGNTFKTEPADQIVSDSDIIEEAGIKLQVLHTPGHTPGGISLWNEQQKIVFTGDSLFADSVGRTDFPGGDMNQLIKAIKGKLMTLDDETVCLPGHGPQTMIKKEKLHNQYLR